MQIQEAVKLRIIELAEKHELSVNRLAERSGISPSALKWTVKPYAKVKSTGIVTIKKICQGLGIDFMEFWNSSLFENLEYEETADEEEYYI